MGGIVQQSGISTRAAQKLSVVVITFNEQENLSALLPAIPEGAEIVLLDSGSTDRTVDIATTHGARVSRRDFDNFAAQKNHAAGLASRPWTLMLDADERPDEALWAEILSVVEANADVAGELPRKLIFCGRKMRFGRTTDLVVRLFKTGTFKYQNEIHEVAGTNSRRVRLRGTLWHYSYKNLEDYFQKFNRYTTLVANDRRNNAHRLPAKWELALRLPVDFVTRYFLRLGCLDGYEGFLWAALGSFYGFIKYAKAIEPRAGASR
jgi:glycosyltransferase involved in cell wall biosynthesis